MLFEQLTALYEDIDQQAAALHVTHAERLQCRRGCSSCCVDDLTVFEVEARHIRHHHSDLLESDEAHPPGACAFLDGGGGCRIYEHRPYVCRTQGLPLRWIDEDEDGDLIEMRDICPLNDEGTPVESLPDDACWKIGPVEDRLRMLQFEMDSGEMNRVALRDMFKSTGDDR